MEIELDKEAYKTPACKCGTKMRPMLKNNKPIYKCEKCGLEEKPTK